MNLAKDASVAGGQDSGAYLFKTPSQSEPESQKKKQDSKYVKVVEKLPSTGPLNIPDLQEFLQKSKIDFEHLYKDRMVSKLTLNDFKIIRKLGEGGYGKVLLAKLPKEDEIFAIKVVNKKTTFKYQHLRYIQIEKRVLQSINFPFCTYLAHFFVDYNNFYFVLPFVSGGDLGDFLNRFYPLEEGIARFYVSQLVLALAYLHYLGIIHRDLKPENVLMDAFGYIKVTDFGLCAHVRGKDRAWSWAGTPMYMAPEIILNKGYDCAVDWWALGVMIYEMCAGRLPFPVVALFELNRLILENKYELPPTFSKPLANLVKLMLAGSLDRRLGNYSRGAREIKAHVWFKNVKWLALLNRTLRPPYVPPVNPITKK